MQSRFLASFLLFLLAFSIQAQEGNWKNLFNGKDLSGWKAVAGKANFSVQDGQAFCLGVLRVQCQNSAIDPDFIWRIFFGVLAHVQSDVWVLKALCQTH